MRKTNRNGRVIDYGYNQNNQLTAPLLGLEVVYGYSHRNINTYVGAWIGGVARVARERSLYVIFFRSSAFLASNSCWLITPLVMSSWSLFKVASASSLPWLPPAAPV